MASTGFMPHSTILVNCLALSPWGVIAGIRSKCGFCAGLVSVAEIFALQAAELLFLLDGYGKQADFFALREDVVVVVDIQNEIGPVLRTTIDAQRKRASFRKFP
jgi:hypothetical protein